jgi:hypothetical protein
LKIYEIITIIYDNVQPIDSIFDDFKFDRFGGDFLFGGGGIICHAY